MKKKQILYILVIIFVILILLAPFLYKRITANGEDENNVISSIEITDFEILETDNYFDGYYVMKVDDTFIPDINYYPETISIYQKKIMWTISDSSKLSIDYNNVFTAKEIGVVEVMATSIKNMDLKKSIKIKIVAKENSLKFDRLLTEQIPTFSVGEISYLPYSINGLISLGKLNWESLNEEIATVDDGYIKGISLGVVKITATSTIDKKYSISLNVKITGKYSAEKVNAITINEIIGVTVKGFKNNLPLENFRRELMHVGYKIELSAKTDVESISDTYFEFEDPSMINVIKNGDSIVEFEVVKVGHVRLYAVSSYFPDVKEPFEFDVYPFNPGDDLSLVYPSKLQFKSENDVNVLELNGGSIQQIKIESNYKEIEFNDLIITSSNDSVARIVDGYIFADQTGESIITIYHINNPKKVISFNVRVKKYNEGRFTPVELINIDSALINEKDKIIEWDYNNVYVGAKFKIQLVIYPIYATNKLFNIEVSNKKICIVSSSIKNNILEIEGEFIDIGYTELTVTNVENNNLKYYCDFLVNNSNPVSFGYKKVSLLERGQTGNCNVVLGNGLKGVEVTYTSSDPSIVSVGHTGELVGLGYGTATISIHATDGVTSFDESFEVECVKEHSLYDALNTFKTNVKMNDEEINLNEKLMYIGDSFTIDVSFTPSNHPFGKYHEVKIEKPEILSVDKNNNKYTFKCLKSGTTKVTVYPYANPDFSVEYTVVIANIMPKFMFVSVPDKVMYVEDRYQFGYLIDWRATYSNVDIIIGDDSMVSVEDDYLVIKKAGKTYVSFIIDDNDDNTVSYVQTLNIEAFDHSTGVRLERYGYGNFIVRIISQVICALIIGILAFVIANKKPLKLNSVLNYVVVICGILVLLILCNVLRMSIKPLGYEKYDMLTNIISYVSGLFIGFVIYLLRSRKEKGKNA